jgi:hypothetical protein
MGNYITKEMKIYPEIDIEQVEINIVEEKESYINEYEDEKNKDEEKESYINEDEDEDEKKDSELDTIKKNIIDRLPEDLVIKIYKDYLEPEVYYKLYIDIIQHPFSLGLDGKLLLPFIPILLAKPIVCKYISTKCVAFCRSFQEHKVNKKKVFRLMHNGQSFASTILFYLYH